MQIRKVKETDGYCSKCLTKLVEDAEGVKFKGYKCPRCDDLVLVEKKIVEVKVPEGYVKCDNCGNITLDDCKVSCKRCGWIPPCYIIKRD